MAWHLVIDYDRRGNTAGTFSVCPTCWIQHPSLEERNHLGRTVVRELREPLHPDEECYHCGGHPQPEPVSA